MKSSASVVAIFLLVLAAIPVAVLGWARLLRSTSESPELALHRQRGDAAFVEGRYADALIAYTRARELAPTDPGLQRALMTARLGLAAAEPGAIADGDLEPLRYEALLLLDVDPSRAALWHAALGNVLVRKGRLDDARASLEAAVRADASSPVAHTALALLLVRDPAGTTKAKAALERALEARPDYVRALLPLAQLHLADGNGQRAQELLERALRVSSDAPTHALLGEARLRQNQLDPAIAELRRAVELDARHLDAQRSLGMALVRAGRASEAERPLRAAAQNGTDLAVLLALATSLTAQRKHEQALAVYTQVLAADSLAAAALLGAGKALEELGRPKDALGHYLRLLQLRSTGAAPNAELEALQAAARPRVAALQAPAVGPERVPVPAP